MADNTFGTHMVSDLLLAGTVNGMDIDKLSQDQLYQAIEERRKVRNQAINFIMGPLSIPTQERGDLIGQQEAIAEWDIATETSREKRVRTAGLTGVGFPIYKFLKRTGWTYDYLARAKNSQIAATFDEIMNAHMLSNYKMALRALFRNTTRDWSDELFAEDGTLKVFPLAHGALYTPPPFSTNTFADTHDHYLALGAAFAEADLTSMADHLREHGYGVSQMAGGKGGVIVVMIHDDQRATVAGFTNHIDVADMNIAQGPGSTTAHVAGASGLDIDTYLGYNSASRCYIRVSDLIPSSYQLGLVVESLNVYAPNKFAPLRRRTPKTAALNGIHAFGDESFPLKDAWYQDFFGYGVGNLLTACVNFMHNSTYSIPAF